MTTSIPDSPVNEHPPRSSCFCFCVLLLLLLHRYKRLAHELNKQGFAVFSFDLQGSNPSVSALVAMVVPGQDD